MRQGAVCFHTVAQGCVHADRPGIVSEWLGQATIIQHTLDRIMGIVYKIAHMHRQNARSCQAREEEGRRVATTASAI